MKKLDCTARTLKEKRGFWVVKILMRVFKSKGRLFNFKIELEERNPDARVWEQFVEQEEMEHKL